ncbi:MAG: bifunctional phosphoglucose/phosphomannose isomerase [Deltaproteobacteria bacterium]|nr:bifunctional phosphoglucose/phosphomannose isomerase [Deltaproteobacteria bacterium]
MYDTIKNFPNQFETSLHIVEETDFRRLSGFQFRQLYYAGMGGSCLAADLFNDLYPNESTLTILRDYQVPATVNQQDLVFVASFSGKTEETLSAMADALKKKASLLCLSHGGKLKELAEKNNLTYLPIPDCIQPRCAVGHFFASIFTSLYRLGKLNHPTSLLVELADYLRNKQNNLDHKGKQLAETLVGKIPLIYGPPHLQGTCRLWKIKINENAKAPSFYNVFPELNHNEMVGFTQNMAEFAMVCLKSRLMHPRILKRMKIMAELFAKKIPVVWVELDGKTFLEETFEAVWLADFMSYYLAKAYHIDPTPVELVESFKKKLGEV